MEEKKIMSISELQKLGYSRQMLYQLAHSVYADKVLVRRGGKFLFDVKQMEKYGRKLWQRQ